MAGLAMADGVESANIVGYQEEALDNPRTLSIKFQAIGANPQEGSNLTNVIDMTLVEEWSDEVAVYNPADGSFGSYMWDGETWVDCNNDDTPVTLNVVPGNSFIVAGAGWRLLGEVASTTTYTHVLDTESGATLLGSAFPRAATFANWDWTNVTDWEDEIAVYDSSDGSFGSYMWNGEIWVDCNNDDNPIAFSTALTDGFIFASGLETLTESLTPYVYGE